MRTLTIALLGAALGSILAPSAAFAGRGSTFADVERAVKAGNFDAISTELERAEHLTCPSCVKIVRPLLDHGDVRVREVAAWFLVRRGLAGSLFRDGVGRLAQADSTQARNGADLLGTLRRPKAVAPLGAALQNPVFDAEARAHMARALGMIGELDALPALSQALSATEPRVRGAALAAMRELRGFVDPTPAVGALSDIDATVRREAAYTIGHTRTAARRSLAGREIIAKLSGLVMSDPDASVRRDAAWALGEIGAPPDLAGDALAHAAQKDPHPFVRSIAQAALGRIRR